MLTSLAHVPLSRPPAGGKDIIVLHRRSFAHWLSARWRPSRSAEPPEPGAAVGQPEVVVVSGWILGALCIGGAMGGTLVLPSGFRFVVAPSVNWDRDLRLLIEHEGLDQ